jgi:hypothetical protein
VIALPKDDWIVREILNVHLACLFSLAFEHDPSVVRIEKSFVGRVWIPISVCIAVVGSMVSAPCSDRALSCAGADNCEYKFQKYSSRIRPVCPKAMISYVLRQNKSEQKDGVVLFTCSDADSRCCRISEEKYSGAILEWYPEGADYHCNEGCSAGYP